MTGVSVTGTVVGRAGAGGAAFGYGIGIGAGGAVGAGRSGGVVLAVLVVAAGGVTAAAAGAGGPVALAEGAGGAGGGGPEIPGAVTLDGAVAGVGVDGDVVVPGAGTVPAAGGGVPPVSAPPNSDVKAPAREPRRSPNHSRGPAKEGEAIAVAADTPPSVDGAVAVEAVGAGTRPGTGVRAPAGGTSVRSVPNGPPGLPPAPFVPGSPGRSGGPGGSPPAGASGTAGPSAATGPSWVSTGSSWVSVASSGRSQAARKAAAAAGAGGRLWPLSAVATARLPAVCCMPRMAPGRPGSPGWSASRWPSGVGRSRSGFSAGSRT